MKKFKFQLARARADAARLDGWAGVEPELWPIEIGKVFGGIGLGLNLRLNLRLGLDLDLAFGLDLA